MELLDRVSAHSATVRPFLTGFLFNLVTESGVVAGSLFSFLGFRYFSVRQNPTSFVGFAFDR
jgi:hypothetical protein